MPEAQDGSHHDFSRYLDASAKRVDRTMRRLLPTARVRPSSVHQSMRYTALSDGKRLRPALVLLACEASGRNSEAAEPVAAALEFVHAFSLIHDDLPCMDDDAMRRGKPSNHRVFGEGIAVLAGDALLTLAFEVLGSQAAVLGPGVAANLVTELSRATGSRGVVGGQVLDLQSEGRPVDLRTVQFIHTRKTARLFQCALRMGALTGGAKPAFLERLTTFGLRTGVAFQIVDDILGAAGSVRELGRKPGRDAERGKATYPKVAGLPASQRAVTRLLREAEGITRRFPSHGPVFRGFVELIDRRRRTSGGELL